jgi:hypothetical protein
MVIQFSDSASFDLGLRFRARNFGNSGTYGNFGNASNFT